MKAEKNTEFYEATRLIKITLYGVLSFFIISCSEENTTQKKDLEPFKTDFHTPAQLYALPGFINLNTVRVLDTLQPKNKIYISAKTPLQEKNIEFNSTPLQKNVDNYYSLQRSASEYPESSDVWKIGGDTLVINITFPQISNIKVVNNYNISGVYLSLYTITGADSIIFKINDISFTKPGNHASHRFTNTQLEHLKGKEVIGEITAYKIELKKINNQNYYIRKGTTKQVKFKL